MYDGGVRGIMGLQYYGLRALVLPGGSFYV
jgi:hypothetical protein